MARFEEVADAAARLDGYRPFNEQAMFDLAAGVRAPRLIGAAERPVGAAIIGAGELDLVIVPAHRGRGLGGAAVGEILAEAPDLLTAWSHGNHPAARALANRHGFEAVRTLLQLRKALPDAGPDAAGPPEPSPAVTIRGFEPEADAAEWVHLNALVFAGHPEQGALTRLDLTARQAQPWYDPDDFLIARAGATGRMVGYTWLKIEGDEGVGEVYVVGVHPDAAGQGLGRTLMLAGLDRLRARGRTSAALYVEADNVPAVRLYRSLGFTDFTVDVQYRRLPG